MKSRLVCVPVATYKIIYAISALFHVFCVISCIHVKKSLQVLITYRILSSDYLSLHLVINERSILDYN